MWGCGCMSGLEGGEVRIRGGGVGVSIVGGGV